MRHPVGLLQCTLMCSLDIKEIIELEIRRWKVEASCKTWWCVCAYVAGV